MPVFFIGEIVGRYTYCGSYIPFTPNVPILKQISIVPAFTNPVLIKGSKEYLAIE
jgi:hypothetical protein